MSRVLFAFFLILCFASQSFAQGSAPSTPPPSLNEEIDWKQVCEGRSISSVSFTTGSNLSYKELSGTAQVAANTLCNKELISEASRRLLERGIFTRVIPELVERRGELVLHFRLEPKHFISEVLFNGNNALEDRELRRLARVRNGTAVTELSLDGVAERIQEGYQKAGFRSAEVSFEFRQLAVASSVQLRCYITEGYQSKIASAVLSGEIPKDLQAIPERLAQDAEGRPASAEVIGELRRNLLIAVRREGFLEALVQEKDRSYDPLSGDVSLTFSLEAGTPISIVFEGNERFDPEELLAPLKLETRTVPFTAGAAFALGREIEEMYQRHGFLKASAESEKAGVINERQIFRVKISEGKRYRIDEISFEGVSAFSENDLLSEIETSEPGWFFFSRWKPGYYIPSQVEEDVQQIRVLYAEEGFFEADVEVGLHINESKQELKVEFFVTEGQRRLISDVDMQWSGLAQGARVAELPPELLLIKPNVVPGQPFSRKLLREEQRRLYESVLELGYPTAAVELQGDAVIGQVRFFVSPGIRTKVGKVLLKGNSLTHDFVLRRELNFSNEMDWNLRAIEKAEQNLAELGYFSQVSLGPEDGALDESVEDLVVEVRERDTGRLEFGVEVNTEDGLHLSSEIGQRNLNGYGHRVVLGVDGYFKTGKSFFDAARIRAGHSVLRFLGTKTELATELYFQSSVELIDQFSYDRFGGWLQFKRGIGEHLRARIGLSAYQERLFDVEPDIIIGEHDDGHTFYTFLTGHLDLDFRDNRFNPRKGWQTRLDARVSPQEIGSEVSFIDATLQQSFLTSLSHRWVWSNKATYRIIEPFGETEVVPLSQRIFLGGINSLRGFSKDSVGPRGEMLNVLGGDRGFYATTELSFDFTEQMIGVLFFDAGQAILRNTGSFQGDTLDFGTLRYSPGFGVHYRTPIGPVRVEYGFALDREFGERAGRFNVSVGTAF